MHDLANRAKNALPGFAFIAVMLLLLEAAALLFGLNAFFLWAERRSTFWVAAATE